MMMMMMMKKQTVNTLITSNTARFTLIQVVPLHVC
jgi:hypothetical protein